MAHIVKASNLLITQKAMTLYTIGRMLDKFS
jgi:hypothetical protein